MCRCKCKRSVFYFFTRLNSCALSGGESYIFVHESCRMAKSVFLSLYSALTQSGDSVSRRSPQGGQDILLRPLRMSEMPSPDRGPQVASMTLTSVSHNSLHQLVQAACIKAVLSACSPFSKLLLLRLSFFFYFSFFFLQTTMGWNQFCI